jgi:hypothetical protein
MKGGRVPTITSGVPVVIISNMADYILPAQPDDVVCAADRTICGFEDVGFTSAFHSTAEE